MNLQYWKRIQHVILWKCKRYIDVPDSRIPDIKLYNYHILKSFARRWSSAQPVAIPGIKLT